MVREVLGYDVWTRPVFEQIENQSLASVPPKMHVIEDCRHHNECVDIDSAGGYVIKLICSDSDSSAEFVNAPSEKSVDEVRSEVIFNVIVSSKSPGSIDLKTKLDDVIKLITKEMEYVHPMVDALKAIDAATGIVSKQIEKEVTQKTVLDMVGKPK